MGTRLAAPHSLPSHTQLLWQLQRLGKASWGWKTLVSPGPPNPPQPGVLSSGQMTRSQEEFGIHLSQALSYLHSHSCHIKTWAALFIGGGGRAGLGDPQACPTQTPLTLPDPPPTRQERGWMRRGLGLKRGRGGLEPPRRQGARAASCPSVAQATPSAATPRPYSRC